MENINLICRDLKKTYGKSVGLDGVNLSLPKGSIIGLLGPNGSGKTTLLKLAAGLLTPTSGSLELCGLPPSELSKEIVAYQPDKIYLNKWMTIENLVNMMEDFYQTFNRKKAMDMLSRLKLNPQDKLKNMSKGNKEKVQLILTMSRDVPLYLLDEPIGGVDPAARDYILNTIINNYQENATVIISTHLITDIENILNYIIFLQEGKVVRSGDVDDIREKEG
ncbi:MAG: ABC transporter ATP-binding protein, partial [Treponema sp.]|nr:ABC transporter ATP-binding protein [Treponema sp.]